MKRTALLTAIKEGQLFIWGEAIKLHEVGPYSILEFHPWQSRGISSYPCTPDRGVIRFHAWVNSADTHHGFSSLDAALVGCVAYAHEGCNHRADGYFMRMIAENSPAGSHEIGHLLDALEDALQWIDAVPGDTTLPAMPGFDRDAVNDLITRAKNVRA